MKKDVDDNIAKKFKKRPKNIQLMKKTDTKDNSKIFGSTFSNNFTSINKVTNRLLNQKKITAKQPHKFNLTNESTLNKSLYNTENYTSNNKNNITFGNNAYKYNQNKKSNIYNKTTSSFYIPKEDKKIAIKNVKKFVLNLSLNDNIKKRNGNNTNIIGNSLTYRNNINTNNDLNKQSTIRKKINKDKNEKQNKIKKEFNKITNKEKINDDSRKNKFERAKTVVKLKTKKNQKDIVWIKKSK